MKILRMSKRGAIVLGVLALAVSAGSVLYVSQAQAGGESTDSGPHSAFTRRELENNWSGADRFPLLVPTSMPAGARTNPEVGFVLENVVTEPVRHPSKRVWLASYESDVLGAQAATFRVFQRPTGMKVDRPCGPSPDQPYISRQVGNAVLTICSSEFSNASSSARGYWETATFTSSLEQVNWLRD